MSLFELKLASGDSIEITDEQADIIKSAIREEAASIQVGEMWLRPAAIMSILPSPKGHSKYKLYLAEKGRGFRGGFTQFLDEAGYARDETKALAKGESDGTIQA